MAKLKGGSYVAGSLTIEGPCTAESFSKPDGSTLVTVLTASLPGAGVIPKLDSSQHNLVDSIITESAGTITIAGGLISNSLTIGASLAAIDAAGAISGASLSVTGAISGNSLSVTGAVDAASVAATGDVSAGSLSIKEDGTSTYRLSLLCNSGLTSNANLTFNVNNASRTVTLGANLSTSGGDLTLQADAAGSTLDLPAGTTTINTLTSGHVLYASGTNTISGEAALSVGRGGTGRTSLTNNYLLYGDGTSAVSMLAPNTTSTPKFLQSVSSGAPAWDTIPNAALDNSSITINGSAVSLGGTITVNTGSSVNYTKSTASAWYNMLWVSQGAGTLTQVYSTDSVQIYPGTGTVKASIFDAVSAREKKTDIKPFTRNALAILRSTEICTYYYKIDENKVNLRTGFIADDTDEVLATKNHDAMDIGSSIGVLIKAVQELDIIVQQQAEEIERLKLPFWKRWFI